MIRINLLGIPRKTRGKRAAAVSGGGEGSSTVIMGVLILGLIQTLITFQGNLNSWWTRIVIGLLVLVFILLQNVIALVSKNKGAPLGYRPTS